MSRVELVRVTSEGDRRIVCIDSRAMNDDSSAAQVMDQLSPACDDLGGNSLHVDLTSVEYLGSPGLNHLIQIHRRVRLSGGEVCLENVGQAVREILKLTRLERLFRVNGAARIPSVDTVQQ